MSFLIFILIPIPILTLFSFSRVYLLNLTQCLIAALITIWLCIQSGQSEGAIGLSVCMVWYPMVRLYVCPVVRLVIGILGTGRASLWPGHRLTLNDLIYSQDGQGRLGGQVNGGSFAD